MPRAVADTNHGNLIIPHEIERQLLDVDLIPVGQLHIDAKYQRPANPDRQSKMAREWNWLACGQLVVSLRRTNNGSRHQRTNNVDNPNRYNVLDGQQRLGSIIMLGYGKAPCRIYVDLTEEQEAELFELLNNAKKPTFNDLFKSRLSRGEEKARNIELACKAVGWELDPERKHKTPRHIQTMLEMERMFDVGKSALIMDTLKFIHDIWPGELLGHQQMILGGVSMFIQKYGRKVRITEMKEKLRRVGQLKTVQQAFQYAAARGKSAGGNNRAIAFSEAMLMIYNQNRQEANRVPTVQR